MEPRRPSVSLALNDSDMNFPLRPALIQADSHACEARPTMWAIDVRRALVIAITLIAVTLLLVAEHDAAVGIVSARYSWLALLRYAGRR